MWLLYWMGSCDSPIPGSPASLNVVLSVPPERRLSVAVAPRTPRSSNGLKISRTIVAASGGPKTLALCYEHTSPRA